MFRAARRASADESGSTAVEFAIVAMPFLAILFAIIETAFVFFAGEMLQTAVMDAGRMIMTGQATSLDRAGFKKAICDRIFMMLDCDGKLDVDVRTMKSFQGAGRASPYVNGVYNTAAWGYDPGGPGAVVVITAAYPWPVMMDLMGFNLANGTSKTRLLTASAAIKNEQF